jgi:hypothetical protein
MKLQAIVVHSVRRAVIGTIALALVALAIQLSANAADNPNTSWYQVISFRFKPGKTAEALQIIHEHFHKVEKAIGRKVMPFDYTTGEWDHVVYFPLDTAKMDTIPSQTEFMKTLADQEGGKEQAQKLFQGFFELVVAWKSEIAQLPAAWAP